MWTARMEPEVFLKTKLGYSVLKAEPRICYPADGCSVKSSSLACLDVKLSNMKSLWQSEDFNSNMHNINDENLAQS